MIRSQRVWLLGHKLWKGLKLAATTLLNATIRTAIFVGAMSLIISLLTLVFSIWLAAV